MQAPWVRCRLLELLTATPASNFALSDSLPDGVAFQAFDANGAPLFTGQIQIEGSQMAVWSDGLARIMPIGDNLVTWLESAIGTADQDQNSLSIPAAED